MVNPALTADVNNDRFQTAETPHACFVDVHTEAPRGWIFTKFSIRVEVADVITCDNFWWSVKGVEFVEGSKISGFDWQSLLQVIESNTLNNKSSQCHLGRACRYTSRQILDSPASCAASCAIPTADESNHSATLHLHGNATCILYVNCASCHILSPKSNCPFPNCRYYSPKFPLEQLKTRTPAKARFGRPYCPITLSPSLIDF